MAVEDRAFELRFEQLERQYESGEITEAEWRDRYAALVIEVAVHDGAFIDTGKCHPVTGKTI
jgi:hypothetical protein